MEVIARLQKFIITTATHSVSNVANLPNQEVFYFDEHYKSAQYIIHKDPV